MKRIIGLVLIFAMCLGLVACGSSNDEASSDPNYKEQTVTYKGDFDVKCINDEIVCGKEFSGKADYIVLTFEVKNISKKDKVFTSYANMKAKQGKETLYLGNLKDKKGKPYYYYRSQKIKPGKTATLKYDYKLVNHKDDVVVNLDSFLVGNEAGKMKFKTEGRKTKEYAKYEAESEKEHESLAKIKKVDMNACKVSVPKGWIVRNASEYFTNMQKDKKDSTEVITISTTSTKIDSSKAEAKKYRKNFNDKKLKLKSYKVDGEIFYGFEPSGKQFYLYGKSSKDYRIEISGMDIGYKEAKDVIDKSIKIK